MYYYYENQWIAPPLPHIRNRWDIDLYVSALPHCHSYRWHLNPEKKMSLKDWIDNEEKQN